MTGHVFDEAVALQATAAPGVFIGATHPAWANMVGPFGGITAAVLLNAACTDPRRLGEPLSLTVNYAGPVVDGPFEIHAQPVRTNRSTQHWLLTQHQAGQVATTASAVFALRRETWASDELACPVAPSADAVPVSAERAPVAWPRRYEQRFVEGVWPDYSTPADVADSRSLLWVRDLPPRPLDVLSLAALSDVFYPRVFRRRQRFVPAGTVSISTVFHATAADLAALGTRPVLAAAQGQRYGQGFFDQVAQIWGDDGRLLATSQQVVYFKE